ncbi:MAG: hypothetical protein J6A21_05950 [Lentisphaeria bacterium]|nr:hypothetical protein [Lentisphaeria bacterium]
MMNRKRSVFLSALPQTFACGGKLLSVLVLLLLFCACSEKKKQSMPKAHPELLLEITEEAKKQNYKAMLPKVTRLQALDQTCAFIAELEAATKMNILVTEINTLAATGKFEEALKRVERYERLNGPSPASEKVRERLSDLVLIEKLISSLRAPRNSIQFRKDLEKLEGMDKKIEFSGKLRNFAERKRSELARFRVAEYGGVCFGLWSDALALKGEDDPAFPVLLAVLEGAKKDFPGIELLQEKTGQAPAQ